MNLPVSRKVLTMSAKVGKNASEWVSNTEVGRRSYSHNFGKIFLMISMSLASSTHLDSFTA